VSYGGQEVIRYKFSDQLLTDLLKLAEKPLGTFRFEFPDNFVSCSIIVTRKMRDLLDLRNPKKKSIDLFFFDTNDNDERCSLRHEYVSKGCVFFERNVEFSETEIEAQNEVQKSILGKEGGEAFFNRSLSLLIVYLFTGTPDLRSFEFPTNGTRAEKTRASMEYHNEDCILVGYNWQKQRQSNVDSWYSRGHFWLAPVGPKRERREIRWRSGCEKTRTQEENINE
jgi:hypothetical protein